MAEVLNHITDMMMVTWSKTMETQSTPTPPYASEGLAVPSKSKEERDYDEMNRKLGALRFRFEEYPASSWADLKRKADSAIHN